MRIRTKWKFIIPFIEVVIISAVLVIGISINRGVHYENGLRKAQYAPGISGIGLSEIYRYSIANREDNILLNDQLIERVTRYGGTITQSVNYNQALNFGTTYTYEDYKNMDFSYIEEVELLGTNREYFELFKPKLIAGRYFTEEELHKNVCVIGEGTAIKLFGSVEDSLGKEFIVPYFFELGKDKFEIVGVVEGEQNLTVKTVYASGTFVDSLYVASDEIFIYPLPIMHFKDATLSISKSIWIKGDKKAAENLVGELKKSNAATEFIINPIPKNVLGNSDVEKLVLSALSVFMLLMSVVAGLNIIGIQLILINRKKEEFGLNMALGACRKDIFLQVMLEALKLVLIPVILGLVTGYISLPFISELTNLTLVADSKLILSSLGGMGLFVIITGIYPAIKGASIDPIVAIGRTPGFN